MYALNTTSHGVAVRVDGKRGVRIFQQSAFLIVGPRVSKLRPSPLSRYSRTINSTSSAAIELKKRKRGLDVDGLKKLFDTEADYKSAWNELSHRILELNKHARQPVP
jgi:CRISPR/Cas system CSM-associated protein Csm4 (group 5 of RAMP superfamily)